MGPAGRGADDANARYNLKAISGPGVIAWAITGTFVITDWVMSVEPTWASSMFPVVFGMNAFICAISLGVLTFYALNADRPDGAGDRQGQVPHRHRHPAVRVHDGLGVRLVLPVHADLGRQPAGGDHLLPQARRPRVGSTWRTS